MGGQLHAPAALPPGKRPGTHCTGGWVGPGPVWTAAEILAPTGIRSQDRPARSESLYRVRYPGPQQVPVQKFKSNTYTHAHAHTAWLLYKPNYYFC
jgi:hypothetical protein